MQTLQITLPENVLQDLASIKQQLQELKKEFKPKEPTKYLTRNEVAKMLSVDISTVHNWSKKGILKPIGIGARVYYKRKEVESAFVELQN
ncbi:helix-turn-helix domain-containing protein [Mesonia mobilis]|uniref:Helix-turn-helix domain-containing protein n=1 Tax=Mesonia mobilis TaxID=369791 RepID=A0ABQ3BIK3_9FLAO|nr:helix-turn-helix domain-containing protein [Mesonia mobilis]MBQ0737500.1 helix-turn-helix domain-containing protein [Aquimarina celericrescens]GGZ45933.1 hypothetical protein GCM10008088_04080 [Mesonia mobilis]